MTTQGGSPSDQTQPLDIPPPDGALSEFGDLRNLVGSPEVMTSYPNHTDYFQQYSPTPDTRVQAHGNFIINSSSLDHERPGLLRSATSPGPSYGRRRPSSVMHDVAHGFLRLPHRERHKPEHEWTVFGELMGNEEEGRSSTSALPDGLRSRNSIRDMLSVSLSHGQRASVSPQVMSVRESPTPAGSTPLPSPRYDLHDSISSMNEPPRIDRSHPQSSSPSPHATRTASASTADTTSTQRPPETTTTKKKSRFALPTIPLLYRNILKCSVAYFIGSLFTFSPYLSGFISDLTGNGPGERTPSPSGHMVATV